MTRERGLISAFILSVIILSGFASALIDCPAGSHTFSGGTQATGLDMCIPDANGAAVGSASGSTSSTSSSTTSAESTSSSEGGTITPSGSTRDISLQGSEMDSRVNSKVNELYGTSIYDQAKKLYDDSVDVNMEDFLEVFRQTQDMEYEAADSLRRAYNIRALNRLNEVWTQIMKLEGDLAEQQKAQEAQNALNVPNVPVEETGGQEAGNPQFQTLISFNSNFQPLTMKLSSSQMQMLGVLSNEQIHGYFDSARREAINNNARLAGLENANLAKSGFAGRLRGEIPNAAAQIEKGASLSPQKVGSFMSQQAQALLGV